MMDLMQQGDVLAISHLVGVGTMTGTSAWTIWFNKAYDCLSMRAGPSEDWLKKGIATALSLQKVCSGL